MRFSLLILAAILVSSLFVAGLAISPYQAAASNSPQEESMPAVIRATAASNTKTSNDYPFQPSYLSLTVTTDKAVYLTGETVNITVSTSAINTHVSLTAQLPGGSQQPIDNFTLNYTHTVSWTAPATSGQIQITCNGDALVEAWDYCTRWVCIGPGDTDCHVETYPCLRTISVTGNAYNNIRVFSRTAPVSGRIIDTNQKPVAGATVSILSTAQSTTANSDGFYQFNSYQLGNNYSLVNQVPTVIDTISVEAVACEPQPGRSIQIQAEAGASEVNFTLNRAFYPPDINLSEFTFAAFPGWPAAEEYATWQNISGITIDGDAQSAKWQYENREISPLLFSIGNKKLFLITTPEFGRYVLDIQGAPGTQYMVSAASTLSGIYLQPITTNATIGSGGSQRLRFILQPNQMQLQVIKPFPIIWIIIPVVVVILGGLAAAYFLTGGKERWGKLFTGKKSSYITEISKAPETVKEKATVKSTTDRLTRRKPNRKKGTGRQRKK
jgi:hypothetical protein